jgi:hypothetical protein
VNSRSGTNAVKPLRLHIDADQWALTALRIREQEGLA